MKFDTIGGNDPPAAIELLVVHTVCWNSVRQSHPSPPTTGNRFGSWLISTVIGPGAVSTPRLVTVIVAEPGWPTANGPTVATATLRSTAIATGMSMVLVLFAGVPSPGSTTVTLRVVCGTADSGGNSVAVMSGRLTPAAMPSSRVHVVESTPVVHDQPVPAAVTGPSNVTVTGPTDAPVPTLATVAVIVDARWTSHGPTAVSVTVTSAGTTVGVVSVAVLLSTIESTPEAAAVSDTDRTALAVSATATVIAGKSPPTATSAEEVHVVAVGQLQPAPEAASMDIGPPTDSVTVVAPTVAAPPRLPTVTVYEPVPGAVNVASPSLTATTRSGETTGVLSPPKSLNVAVSPPPLTFADRLACAPAAMLPASTVTVIDGSAAPGATTAVVAHEAPAPAHVQPAPAADSNEIGPLAPNATVISPLDAAVPSFVTITE